MPSRYSYYGIILIAVTTVGSITAFGYLAPMFLSPTKTGTTVVIHIPVGSHTAPSYWQWGNEDLSSPTFPFPTRLTVMIGLNNTIEWINDDTSGHTVTALIVPSGATYFDSGLVNPGKTFATTLTVPGTYKYACVWHNWLAGEITVKTS